MSPLRLLLLVISVIAVKAQASILQSQLFTGTMNMTSFSSTLSTESQKLFASQFEEHARRFFLTTANLIPPIINPTFTVTVTSSNFVETDGQVQLRFRVESLFRSLSLAYDSAIELVPAFNGQNASPFIQNLRSSGDPAFANVREWSVRLQSSQSVPLPPTSAPTVQPSAAPTRIATDAPSASPTQVPSAAPTETVTLEPTQQPSPWPTMAPSPLPTARPTAATTMEESQLGTPLNPPTPAPTTAPLLSQTYNIETVPLAILNAPGPLPAELELPVEQVTENFLGRAIAEKHPEIKSLRVDARIRAVNNPSRRLQETDSSTVIVIFRVIFTFEAPTDDYDANALLAEGMEDEEALLERLRGIDPFFQDVTRLQISSLAEEASNDNGGSGNVALYAAIGGGVVLLVVVASVYFARSHSKGEKRSQSSPMPTTSNSQERTTRRPNDLEFGDHGPEIILGPADDISTLGDPFFGNFRFDSLRKAADDPTASIVQDYDFEAAYNGPMSIPSEVSSDRRGRIDSASAAPRTLLTDDQSFEDQYGEGEAREEFEVEVPPGPLGIVIATPDRGAPIVQGIRDDCQMRKDVLVGDRLISIDAEDVSDLSKSVILKMLSDRADKYRTLGFSRPLQPSYSVSN